VRSTRFGKPNHALQAAKGISLFLWRLFSRTKRPRRQKHRNGRAAKKRRSNKHQFDIKRKEEKMAESVYKIIRLVGTSPKSWEEAAKNAVETAGKTLRDLRIAEIDKLDLKVEGGKVVAYRALVNLSFKYGGEG